MTQAGYDINVLLQEAQRRWLKPAEVLFILQNHEKYELTQEPVQRPSSGSVFLFNKRVLRFFRRDGHNWRKKKDGRAVGEAHERLKVGNVEALNCYYAHGEENPSFQRRSFWILDPAYEHIVLVHYRDTAEGQPTVQSATVSPVASSTFSLTSNSHITQNPASSSVASDLYERYQNISSSASVEVSSGTAIENNGADSSSKFNSINEIEVSQALRRLEEQLSLNDDIVEEIGTYPSQDLEYKSEISRRDHGASLQHSPEYIALDQYNGRHDKILDDSNDLLLQEDAGNDGKHQSYGHTYNNEIEDPLSWKHMLNSCKSTSGLQSQNQKQLGLGPAEEQECTSLLNFNGSDRGSSDLLLPQEVGSDYYTMLFDQNHVAVSPEADMSLSVAQRQKFTIREVSPEWGNATEATKVIIVGSFLCNPSESMWSCMFGGTEVPIEIIQEGVIRCEAPPHPPGKVTLCITSGNREACSEVKEFDYRDAIINPTSNNLCRKEATKSRDELLLLVKFVQLLLSDSAVEKGDGMESGYYLLGMGADNEIWEQLIETLLVGSGTSSGIIDCLLEELLKDKLQQWLSSKGSGNYDQSECSLSKKEQGIIHMVAGLGLEWALKPVLSHGVSANFRDINGWTALHWAARFGREKMVAALLASGAFAGAVTDPTTHDPTGKTPASIAASCGHKGLAGYLSEKALTSHLSSLTLEESELSKASAEVEAEITVNSVSNRNLPTSEDQVSLKHTLAAVRNATQAAARIQSAFRAHSFRRRQEREVAASYYHTDGYGINPGGIPGISAMSKRTFRNAQYNSAALSIQKKYRGWKGRKDFLSLRQKVVKIQAHVRGYQVRKNYRVCWAVGILEKVVLRWRRKGAGLRGFRNDAEFDESDDEDILKVFRKQKVDGAIEEAVSRVLSMVDSPEARLQYRRMLERFQQAKAEHEDTSEGSTSISAGGIANMENNDSLYPFA